MKRIFIILLLSVASSFFLQAKQEEREDALKPDKSHRGLVDMSQVFVPKGQWLTGLTASFSTHNNDMYNIVIINDVESEGYTVKFSPMLGYAIRNNMVVGVKFGYSRNLLSVDNGGVSIGGDSGISLNVDTYYSLKHTYEGSMFWRQYIPFGNNKRFALFSEAQLIFGGSQAKYMAHLPVKGTYETSFSTTLNFTPGIAAFITNDVALELNVGVMGVTFQTVRQIHNQVETGKRNESLMNFKINLLSIGLGLAIYL